MSIATATDLADALSPFVVSGSTIALGDGVGALDNVADATSGGPTSIGSTLTTLARRTRDVRLVIGWMPIPLGGVDPGAFSAVIALMPGWGVRGLITHPHGRFVPTRLSAVRAALADTLRPDVLITRLARREDGGLCFTTEVSWQRDLIATGVPVIGVVDPSTSGADAGPPLDPSAVRIVDLVAAPPAQVPRKAPDPIHEALADAVMQFIPAGARLQYGPGQLGTALLERLSSPVRIDTGLLTDAVVDLDQRGLLAGIPSATYLLGTEKLYRWADGKPILREIGHTHDLTRLSTGDPFIAVNTAIEIDPWGQINVEGIGSKVVGGIGGHPDFCAAAAASPGGLSIIAVPSHRVAGGHRTTPLVDRLSRPVSTPAYDIDLIVTETRHADLRGTDWDRRRELIADLFHDKE